MAAPVLPASVAPSEAGEPLGIVAGGGDLPRLVAEQAVRHGWAPQIVAIGDGIDADWAPYPHWAMPWGKVGDLHRRLRGAGVRRLVLCGTVSVRPDFRTLLPSLRTLAMLPAILRITRGGDDTLLRAAARAFEQHGFDLLAVQEIVPELVMPEGCFTRHAPSADETSALARGFEAARVIGTLDVGQAAVASKDRIIALEGIEGTREMLERVADLRARGRIGARERCVLVKGVKPGQDLRFDLPSIGVSTIEEAAGAGLAGIGLSARHALVIRFEDVVAEADKRGLFLLGQPFAAERSERGRATMKIAFVVGEHSSDRLGADLIAGLKRSVEGPVELAGLGGDAMAAEGLKSLFDIDELSIIGVGAILARLPQLVGRLRQTVRHVVDSRPDALVVIDSYAFSHRVARRVRARLPQLPIINYVPPAVWAYHPERSTQMRAYIDRAICLFPFEPEFHRRYAGPPATYVGHPLMHEPHLTAIMDGIAAAEGAPRPLRPPTLLVLPGSRRGEINRLLGDFGRTLEILDARMPGVRAILPAVPRLEAIIEERVSAWRVKPQIVSGEAAKWAAFAQADAALAASGTVALELALAGVPMAVCYRLDRVSYLLRHWMTAWTACLPNFIADYPLVPEHFHEVVRPELLARRLERLLTETPERRAQLAGFAEIRRRMAVATMPGDAAAEIVLAEIARPRPR